MNETPSKVWKYGMLLIRWGIGILFIWSGAAKGVEPLAFADSVSGFRILPLNLVNTVALCLPLLEICLGMMLVLGLQVRRASLGVLLLSILFAMALIQAMVRGLQVDCGCFGSGGVPSRLKMWLSLGRDLLILGGAWWLYRDSFRWKS